MSLKSYLSQGIIDLSLMAIRYTFKKNEDIQLLKLRKTSRHTIDVLLDACEVNRIEKLPRLQDSIEKAFALAQGVCKIIVGENDYLYAAERMC